MESILEGQNDSLILRKIMKNLPIDLLKQNLAWIYEKYQSLYDKNYQNDAFNHVISISCVLKYRLFLTFIVRT